MCCVEGLSLSLSLLRRNYIVQVVYSLTVLLWYPAFGSAIIMYNIPEKDSLLQRALLPDSDPTWYIPVTNSIP